MFLVIIDAHSKWTEADILRSSNMAATTKHLRNCFRQFGKPVMVLDNRTSFSSIDFCLFVVLLTNGQLVRRHVDPVHHCSAPPSPTQRIRGSHTNIHTEHPQVLWSSTAR